MPFPCGLPCFKARNQRHKEENIVEKPIYIAVPVQTFNPTTATVPTHNQTTPEPPTSLAQPETANSLDSDPPSPPTGPTKNPEPEADMAEQLKGVAGGVSNTASSGAQKASSGAQSAAGTVTGQGTKDWDAMTEDQKKQTFDSLPAEKKHNLSYYEWVMQGYQHQKENWMPWIEDVYLKWFTKDNKVSYATKDTLDKSKVTGVEQVDTLQDGVNNLAAGQVGQGGLLQPVGDMASKEGVNRAERGGKDDSGSCIGAVGSGVSSAGGSVWNGAKGAGGYVSGMFGGKKAEGKEESK